MTSSFSTRTYASPTIARSSRTKMSLFIEVAMCLTQLRDQGSGIRDPRKTTTFCYLRSSDPGSRLPNPVVSFLSGPHPGRHRLPDRHIRALPDGQELSGIHDAVRIKRPLHTLHRHQVGVGKHPAHVLPLFDSHPMFACDGAPGFDAGAKDLLARPHHLVHDSRLAGIEEDDRVQIAIPGVEQVADGQAVRFLNIDHLAHDVGELVAGHDTVMQVV